MKKPSEIKLPLKFSKIKLDTNSINQDFKNQSLSLTSQKKSQGIPYAEPPLGDLRFKKTKPLEENAWEGVFDGRFKSGTVYILGQ